MKWIIIHSIVLGNVLTFLLHSTVNVINGVETVTYFLITYPSLVDVGINIVIVVFFAWRINHDVKKYKIKTGVS